MKVCRNCGKELYGRKRVFCSRACSNSWWIRERSKGLREGKTCPVCNKPFSYRYSAKKYCSDQCRWKAENAKKKLRYPRSPRTAQSLWRIRRHEIAKSQDNKCFICGEELTKGFHVHHLLGGDDRKGDSEHVVALHPGCHNQFHKVTLSTDGKEWWVSGKIFDMLSEVNNMKSIEIRKGG